MMRGLLKASCLGLLCGVTMHASLQGEDAPTFRGANRTSVYDGKKLVDSWPEQGPKLLWETAGAGRGYASVAISGGKFYTLGDGLSTAEDKDEYLTCFDLNTGKQLWKTKTGEAWNSGQASWQSSRGTPTVDGNSVYVITPFGKLFCCSTANGSVEWSKDFKAEFGGNKADGWGFSESPLIDGDMLLCTPGGKDACMVAMNKKTGNVLWKCPHADDRGAGHASIVISNVGGTKVYVTTTGSGGIGVSKDGKLLWDYPIDKTTAVIPTPIVKDDLVYLPFGYGRGSALVRQVPGPNGAVKSEVVYDLNTKLANKHGGVVRVGDYVFCDGDDRGIPMCAEMKTGEIKWQQRGPGKGSAVVIAGDGKLFIQFQDGTLVLARATADKYEELGKFTLPGSGERPSWAHPVIVDGKLYVRQQDKILCYDISA
ncbi:MAG: PQQ-binding-like beta-propeller repeat protein [Pirellulales bacterium]